MTISTAELRPAASIATLRERIARLPADPLYAGYHYNNQQGHWELWLAEYLGAGAYDRKVIKDDVRYCYNHVVNSQLLVYLGWASGVDSAIQSRGEAAASSASKDHMQRASAAYRRIVTWEMIYDRLWPSGTSTDHHGVGESSYGSGNTPEPLVCVIQFTEAIRRLPADSRKATRGAPYAAIKEKWLAWLDAYRGVGGYERKLPRDDAAYIYNNLEEFEMLEYLAWACGIGAELRQDAAKKILSTRRKAAQPMVTKFRRVIPWELIRDKLWPELAPKRLPGNRPNKYGSANTTVSRRFRR